jgi:hypothetical protein
LEGLRELDCYQNLVLCLVGLQVDLLALLKKLEASLGDILDHGNLAPGLADAFIGQEDGLHDFPPLQLTLPRWVQQLKVYHAIHIRIIGCLGLALLFFFLLVIPRVLLSSPCTTNGFLDLDSKEILAVVTLVEVIEPEQVQVVSVLNQGPFKYSKDGIFKFSEVLRSDPSLQILKLIL